MSKKGKGLFFPIQPHWNKDKLAVIIDGKAYRSLESYNIWETKETTKGLIDAVARGSLLIDHNTTVPDSVSNVSRASFNDMVLRPEFALVATIPPEEQIEEAIRAVPHNRNTYSIPGCT